MAHRKLFLLSYRIDPMEKFNLRTRLQAVRQRWQLKNPTEKWTSICKFAKVTHQLIGIRLFDDRKNYWYTASAGICAAIYFLLNFYTIHYYLFRREFVRLIECSYLIGPVVGVR